MSHLRGVVAAAMQLYAGRDVYYGERTLARSLGISRQVEHKKKKEGATIKAEFGGEKRESKRGGSFFIRAEREYFQADVIKRKCVQRDGDEFFLISFFFQSSF